MTQSTFSLLALVLPFTLDFDLTIWEWRIKKNYEACLNEIRAYCENSSDPDSVYRIVISHDKNADEVFIDLISFMLGGSESSAKVI